MIMNISNNILKESLKNVYFIAGGAYGGKTTMAKLIEKKHGILRYRQGDKWDEHIKICNQKYQPTMSFDRSNDWYGYFSQPAHLYHKFLMDSIREQAEFAIMDLIKLSQNQKVIADVIIPIDYLVEIADYSQVVLLFAPVEMKRQHYFDRDDKKDLLNFLKTFKDSDFLLENVLNSLTYQGEEELKEFYNSGFKCIERTDKDTLENTLSIIEKHFCL